MLLALQGVGPFCTMDGCSELEYVTALADPAPEQSPARPPTVYVTARAESVVEATESGPGTTSVEEEIERSKCHWSELTDFSDYEGEDSVAVDIDNRQVFKTLQSHPDWGHFFRTFGYDTEVWRSCGELEVGEKFAEGAQAQLFHANLTWNNAEAEELYESVKWVLKVFKKGTMLRHLQSQWPQGYLQYRKEEKEWSMLGIQHFLHCYCHVCYGILLEDGRFAFLMRKHEEDLCHLIDHKMMTIGKEQGPFSKVEGEFMMHDIACGMDCLHKRNIVHRDLKASNVLCSFREGGRLWDCIVADFDCSIGVVGTGFWRAPEILQACKDRNVSQRQELFTKAADVYSYGMTCYEILIGKQPFGDHPKHDYDLVLNGQQPELADYIDNWIHDLLSRCWHPNPAARPSFGDIVNIIESNSIEVFMDVREEKKSRISRKAIML